MINFPSYSLGDKQKIWCYFKRGNILKQVGKIVTALFNTSHAQGNSCKLLLFECDTS